MLTHTSLTGVGDVLGAEFLAVGGLGEGVYGSGHDETE